MLPFQTEDEEYVAWLVRDPAGFVLNLGRKPDPMIHRPPCSHLLLSGVKRPTAAPKACSLDREELERWGREAGLTVIPCSTCKTQEHPAPTSPISRPTFA